ncbi:MAG: DUF481 domain-containing protein [Acidobacteria bacterium]|nr:DUF481 domain-containing protein [Acidobacteriota bacterium]
MRYQALAGAFAALLLASTSYGGVIVLKNGDRVTGDVIKKDAKNLTIKSVNFGVVTVAWDQVASVTEEKPVTVVTADGKSVEGTLATSGEAVQVVAGGQTQSLPPSEISAIRNADEQKAYLRMLKPRLVDLWTVTGNLGLAATAGNAKTSSFTLPINAARMSRSDKTTIYFNLIRATAMVNNVSATTAQAVRGGWAYSRNLHPRLFWNFFNDYEYDRFQNLDLRVVAGSGLGYGVWKGERGRLDLVGGANWNRESFDPVRPLLPFIRNSAELFWGDDWAYKLSGRANVTQSYRMFNNLSKTGEYRQNFDFGLNTKLTKWLTWNAALSDRFLSNPAPGRKKNDVLFSTGFGFTFAR